MVVKAQLYITGFLQNLDSVLDCGLDYELTALLKYSGSDQCLSLYLIYNWQLGNSFSAYI